MPGPVLLDPRLEMSMTTRDKHSSRYVNTCVPCWVLHRPGKMWNRGGTFHQRLLKLREACSSTVGRLGACKSEEKNSVLSVQCGEEICQSVYSSHSSAWKRDLLKENLEMQLLRQKKKKREGGKKKEKNKTKEKPNKKKYHRTIYYHEPSLQNVGVQHLAAYFPGIYSSTRQDWLRSHSKRSVRTRLLRKKGEEKGENDGEEWQGV